jgi:molybdopterin converting factor small subunit
MKITVFYLAQLKQAAGRASETVEMDSPRSVLDLVRLLAERHGDGLRRLLFAADGSIQPTNLIFIGDMQVRRPADAQLKDGDSVTVLSPIAGG